MLQILIAFPNFTLICSYFVLVTVIIFDLTWHICIFIIHAEYFWLVMTGLKEKCYTFLLKFVYITFCLLREPQKTEDFEAYTLFYSKVSSELLCILFIHCSFVCQVYLFQTDFFFKIQSSMLDSCTQVYQTFHRITVFDLFDFHIGQA